MTRASNMRRATMSPPTKINKNVCLNPLNPRTNHKKQATNCVIPNPSQHQFPHHEDISIDNIGWNEWTCQKVAAIMINHIPFPSSQKMLSDMLMVLGDTFDIIVWDIMVGEDTCWMVWTIRLSRHAFTDSLEAQSGFWFIHSDPPLMPLPFLTFSKNPNPILPTTREMSTISEDLHQSLISFFWHLCCSPNGIIVLIVIMETKWCKWCVFPEPWGWMQYHWRLRKGGAVGNNAKVFVSVFTAAMRGSSSLVYALEIEEVDLCEVDIIESMGHMDQLVHVLKFRIILEL